MSNLFDWFLLAILFACLIALAYFGYNSDPSDHIQNKGSDFDVVHIVSETDISCESKKVLVIKEK